MRTAGLAMFWLLVGVTIVGVVVGGLKFAVTATPRIGLSGKTLCVKVTVPRKAENRQLAVAVDCERFFRSWQETIRGEDGPSVFDECFDSMPAGECLIGATVYRIDPKAKMGVSWQTTTARACFVGGDVRCE